jgi:hypothetical protein
VPLCDCNGECRSTERIMSKVSCVMNCLISAFVVCALFCLYCTYDYGNNHGLKPVQFRVITSGETRDCGQSLALELLSRKRGFVTIILVDGYVATVIRSCDQDHPIYPGSEYPVEICTKQKSGRIYVIVTPAVLSSSIVEPINAELSCQKPHPVGDDLLELFIYTLTRRQGHQWVGITRVQ